MTDHEFRCPACGFRIFNRRLAACESCGDALPPDLLYSTEEKAGLDAEHDRSVERWRVKESKSNSDPAAGLVKLPWITGPWDGDP